MIIFENYGMGHFQREGIFVIGRGVEAKINPMKFEPICQPMAHDNWVVFIIDLNNLTSPLLNYNDSLSIKLSESL